MTFIWLEATNNETENGENTLRSAMEPPLVHQALISNSRLGEPTEISIGILVNPELRHLKRSMASIRVA